MWDDAYMLKQPTIEDGIWSKILRINFYEQRDGKEEAMRIANRLLDTYHRCLSDKEHFARLKEYRGSYIGSICFLEQYVGDLKYGDYYEQHHRYIQMQGRALRQTMPEIVVKHIATPPSQ